MNKKISYIHVSSYVMLIAPIVMTLMNQSISKIAPFSFLALGIITNSQIRKIITKDYLIILSILIEIFTILYMGITFEGFSYLILFSTLIDIYMKLSYESIILSIITLGAMVYNLYSTYSITWIGIHILFFIVFHFFLLEIRRELEMRTNMEGLYDEIRRKNHELEGARSRLMEYSRRIEHSTQLEERNRISRELHDSIGHNLTGILLQVDAAIQMMEVDTERSKGLLHDIYHNVSNSMETLRETVQRMRPKIYKQGIGTLEKLIQDFKEKTGVCIELKNHGNPYPLLPSVEMTIYRNIQEALTNAVRHGHAKNIHIKINYAHSKVTVEVRDDGVGGKEFQKGFGLNGMEERMELIGGTIDFYSEDGFQVLMSIPRREEE